MALDQTAGVASGILGKKLLAYILLFSSVITTVTSLIILYSDYLTELDKKEASLAQVQLSYVPSLSQSLWNVDTQQIRLQLAGIKNFPYIAYVMVQGTEGEFEEVGQPINVESEKGYDSYAFKLVHSRDDERIQIGDLSVVVDERAIYASVYDRALMIVFAQFIKTTIVSIFVLFIVHRLITRHMETLARWARSANLSVPVSLRRKVKMKDELDLVVDSINGMRALVQESIDERDKALKQLEYSNQSLEEKVDERTKELLEVIDKLNDSFNTLSATRRQLVETEKLAQLGNLVAGVAHELNTPLGVCVTICSLLETTVQDMQNKKANIGVTKQDFDDFVAQMSDSSKMMSENVERASRIVQSFKRLAVKKSSKAKIRVNVKAVLESCLADEMFSMSDTHVEFTIDCPEWLTISTYEGTLETIVMSLVVNSIEHGGKSGGNSDLNIHMIIKEKEGQVEFLYSDDGQGIESEARDHIFEPFFTTSRNKGNVGLGMHLTYNLVTQIMNGVIECMPSKGGARFKLSFPIKCDDSQREGDY